MKSKGTAGGGGRFGFRVLLAAAVAALALMAIPRAATAENVCVGGAIPEHCDNPAAYDFGDIPVGETGDADFTIRGTGFDSIVWDVEIEDDTGDAFSVTDAPEFPAEITGSIDISVDFTPGAVGPYTAALRIDSTDLTDPWFVYLSGAGVSAETAMGMMDGVAERLAGLLPTRDPDLDEDINKALGHLDKALESDRWDDGDRVNDKKVFGETKKAVKRLMKAESESVAGDIEALVAAAGRIARTAIADAAAAGGDPGHLAKATEHMTDAGVEIGQGHFDKAVKKYEKAWKEALKAVEG
jgi:hypothetical protein